MEELWLMVTAVKSTNIKGWDSENTKFNTI